jgi:hypothetical protein
MHHLLHHDLASSASCLAPSPAQRAQSLISRRRGVTDAGDGGVLPVCLAPNISLYCLTDARYQLFPLEHLQQALYPALYQKKATSLERERRKLMLQQMLQLVL